MARTRLRCAPTTHSDMSRPHRTDSDLPTALPQLQVCCRPMSDAGVHLDTAGRDQFLCLSSDSPPEDRMVAMLESPETPTRTGDTAAAAPVRHQRLVSDLPVPAP